MNPRTETRTLWLVRHGHRQDVADPDWLKTAARPHDCPLSAQGRQQAREVGQALADQPIDHIVTSPFLRAVQTASLINEARRSPLKLKIEPGLSELQFERWFPAPPDLPTAQQLAERFAHVDVRFAPTVELDYPETEADADARVVTTLRLLLARCPGNLLLVTHGGTINAISRVFLPSPAFLHSPTCCLIKLVQQHNRWTVAADGSDVSHLTCPEVEASAPR